MYTLKVIALIVAAGLIGAAVCVGVVVGSLWLIGRLAEIVKNDK